MRHAPYAACAAVLLCSLALTADAWEQTPRVQDPVTISIGRGGEPALLSVAASADLTPETAASCARTWAEMITNLTGAFKDAPIEPASREEEMPRKFANPQGRVHAIR